VRLGYTHVKRYPFGYFGWQALYANPQKESSKTEPIGVHAYFPACRFILLSHVKDREYLQIQHTKRNISLEDIPSEYIFIELYNEMCSACIDEVENYKGLFKKIRSDDRLRDRVKMMGIGVGSKKRSVAKFRKTKEISFPLVADEKWELFDCLGKPTLPVAYLVQQADGGRKIRLIKSGHISSVNDLKQKITMAVSLNELKK